MSPEYGAEIPGLCPARCSCDQCRAARRADPGYMAYVERRQQEWLRVENQRTLENARQCDLNGRIYNGNTEAVLWFQNRGQKLMEASHA